jgi:hypothetical protein
MIRASIPRAEHEPQNGLPGRGEPVRFRPGKTPGRSGSMARFGSPPCSLDFVRGSGTASLCSPGMIVLRAARPTDHSRTFARGRPADPGHAGRDRPVDPAHDAGPEGRDLKGGGINPALISCDDDVLGWSMRPWESVPARRGGGGAGFAGSHGPADRISLRIDDCREVEGDSLGSRPAMTVGDRLSNESRPIGRCRSPWTPA